MSYRYVIVEDEPMVQKGTEIKMQRTGLPFALAGVADNGTDGLELIRRTRPELAIVDMQMANGDGMELMRNIRQEGIRLEIIVISAFSDFRYAHAGIVHDVCAYLIKPFSEEELRGAVLTSMERIEKGKRHEMEDLRSGRKEECKILQNYLAGVPNSNILPEFRQLAIGPESGWYVVAELYFPEGVVEMEKPGFLKEMVCLEIQGMPRRRFLVGYSEKRFTQKELDALELLCQAAESAGISLPCRDLDCLWVAGRQAQEARRDCRLGEGGVHRYSGSPGAAEAMERRIADKLAYALENGNPEEFRAYAAEFALACKKQGWSVNQMIRACREFYGRMLAAADAEEDMAPTLYQFDYMEQRCEADGDLPMVMADFMFRTLSRVQSGESAPDLFSGICIYLEKHFNEDLSLDLVSDLFHLSPGYVSQLFGRRLKTTYTNYITKLRIENACRLLEEGRSIAQTAKKCGFRNEKYFHKVFKKWTGETPQEYRTHKQTQERR